MLEKLKSYAIWFIFIFMFFYVVSMFSDKNTNKAEITKISVSEFSREEKVKKLEKSFKAYKELTPVKHKIMWMKKYKKIIYKLGGDIATGRSDCSRSVFHYWWDLGGQMTLKDVKNLEKELKSYVALNKMKIRKRIHNVEIGDIVIFEPPRGKRTWHMGLVNRITRTQVVFQDVNPTVNWTTDRNFTFGGKWLGYKIRVYEMSWDYWIYDSLK